MAQLVARLHGMQKVRGSNPLSSTEFFERLSSGQVPNQVPTRLRPSQAVRLRGPQRWRALVGVPVADTGSPGHLAEPPVERVAGIHAAVLVAKDEVVVLPSGARGQPF